MSDWYVSSVAWAAIPQFAASTAYTVGQIVRPLTAPTFITQYAFRCTTAGTSSTEPTWPAANNGTVTTGGATFTNVSGQSTYGWSAVAGTLASLSQATNNRSAAGDRIFLSSDHNESNSAVTSWLFNNATHAFGLIQIVSVNRAGSVPPVAVDITNGASIGTSSGNVQLEAYCNLFWQGVTFSSGGDIRFNGTATKQHYLKNCILVVTGVSAALRIGSNVAAKFILDGTTAQFGNASQAFAAIGNGPFELLWINTPSAIQGATIPTILFNDATSSEPMSVICRGVDLSAITGTLCGVTTGYGIKVLFDSCRVASGATRLSTPVGASTSADEVELVNCYDGTNVLNERYTYAGVVTTDRSTYLTGGAQDDVGTYSLKLASSSRSDKSTMLLDCFAFDVENTLIGSSKTATVEIISSASFNNDDIRLLLEYMGTSGNPVASFSDSLASVLSAASTLPSSTATWNIAPVAFDPATTSDITLSNNNLTATHTVGNNNAGARDVDYQTTGKFYFEVTMVTVAGAPSHVIGLLTSAGTYTDLVTNGTNCVATYVGTGNIYSNNASTGKTLLQIVTGDVVGIAIDLGARKGWLRKNAGNWNGDATHNPVTGAGGVTVAPTVSFAPAIGFTTGPAGQAFTANFGATSYANAAPSGFSNWPTTVSAKQQLQVTFTPQRAGRVRGLVRLGKPSATVWVNPQITIAAGITRATMDVAGSGVTITGGALVTHNSGNTGANSSLARSSGKYYCEFTITVGTGALADTVGIKPSSVAVDTFINNSTDNGVVYLHESSGGQIWVDLVAQSGKSLGNPVTGDVACMAVDFTNSLIWFRKNAGNWNNDGTANPATGVGGITIPVDTWNPVVTFSSGSSSNSVTVNFGATAYAQARPAGFNDWS